MTSTRTARRGFGIAAVIAFLAATFGSDVIARMVVAEDAFGTALYASVYSAADGLIGSMLLLLPFAVITLLAVWTTKKVNIFAASLLFAASIVALTWMYFSGYWGAQLALKDQKWTAASLSVGLLPFMNAMVLVPAAASAALLVGTAHFLRTRHAREET